MRARPRMYRLCSILLAAGALGSVAATAQQPGPQKAQPPAEQDQFVTQGRAFAEKNCSRCHALGDSGPSPHAQAPPFRMVVERYPSENLAEALAEGIVAGHPDMPVFVLTPDEIEAFLAYLDSLGPKAKKR